MTNDYRINAMRTELQKKEILDDKMYHVSKLIDCEMESVYNGVLSSEIQLLINLVQRYDEVLDNIEYQLKKYMEENDIVDNEEG